jgi:hypothetical protein
MLTLGQICLLSLSKQIPFDHSDPILNDQLFDVVQTHRKNQQRLRSMRTRIKKLVNRVREWGGYSRIHLSFRKSDRIVRQLTDSLFEDMNWNTVKTSLQAQWKEYYHHLYELLVIDSRNDHANCIVLANEIVKYHGVLDPPPPLPVNDPMYPQMVHIKSQFEALKQLQVKMFEEQVSLRFSLNDSLNITTSVQVMIVNLRNERLQIEEDNVKYDQILDWVKQAQVF